MHNTLQSISTEVLVTVGKFDGSNPCLAYLTASTWTKASSSKSCDIAFKPILSNSDVHYPSIVQVSANAMLTCKLSNSSFGFLLQDGTIGITHNFPNVPSNIEVSTESLMVGYADGTLEARSATTGEVFWADGLDGTSVLAICSLPGNGADSLICVCVVLASGAVHVFNSLNKAGTVVVDTCSQLIAEIEEVLEKKYTIWSEMETAQLKLSSAPPDSFSCYFEAVYESHTDEHGCFLHLTEKHESSFISVEPASFSKLKLNLPLIQISMSEVRVLIKGTDPENQQTCFAVYTQTLALPQFSLLKYTHPEKIREPLELVITFQSKLNLSEYIKWIQKDFLDTHHLLQNVSATSDTLDSIELASQIIHSYARHFSQLTLKVSTNKAYGQVHTELKALAEKVCDLRNMIGDGRITSFDPIRQIKGLTRRVDSCWEIEDFDGAKRDLLALDELHRSLAFEHKKSLHHQTELEKTTEFYKRGSLKSQAFMSQRLKRGHVVKMEGMLLTDQVDIQSLLP
ncbi:hypothetical protein BCR33DRAFT_724281 [Rhizoclosmatium globosum]|uniref:Uncharacterized protein n=1 Tax=Rhizoclosmatium globosum TaxID=329046 RepID=A0A1Y2B6I7_9FUNG|nr:hypothetical protein BCR33DRAFT_724281 [Rhizoclosmatium globosum]|eukprot:ORY30451.1 hypothetical protein BCR33DRAFT_724281 [Rhizoclosmatium globosum]